jgi:tRNA U34 5-carboxymethylaminomethyl modifying enzyme MnmG/GidA
VRTFPGRGHHYDMVVVGAGIAGSEAALLAARAGLDVLLVTTSLDTLYMLAHQSYPLRPPAETLMWELCSRLVDGGGAAGGPVERWALHRAAKYVLESQEGIHLLQSNVTELILDADRKVGGVRTWEGVERLAGHTALCVGSFLGARLEQGKLREVAGRLGEMAYDELFEDLRGHGVGFRAASLEIDEEADGLPYRVDCQVIERGELEPNGLTLSRLSGLHAAGVCVSGALPYEGAASAGRRLGEELISALARGGS